MLVNLIKTDKSIVNVVLQKGIPWTEHASNDEMENKKEHLTSETDGCHF